MARKRMIDPDVWFDEDMADVDEAAQFFHVKTWTIADDQHATFPHKPKWLRVELMPHMPAGDAIPLIEKYLWLLQQAGKIFMFEAQGQQFWYIKDFFKYQVIDRPSKAKYPEFNPNHWIHYKGPLQVSLFQTLDEHSTSTRLNERKNEINKESKFFITRNPKSVKAGDIYRAIDNTVNQMRVG